MFYKTRPSSEMKGVFLFKNFWKNFVFIRNKKHE